jgi:uncharacterized protein (TIGR03545 family)
VRWKGILFLIVLAGIVFALNLIFTDTWLEKRLESAGSSLVGAKVEIDRLDFSLLGLRLRWDSLQVTNPKNTMKNIFTTGRTDFNFDLLPLLQKKVLIENLQMTSVTSGTDRTTDGKIEKKVKSKKEGKPNVITKTIDRMQQQIAEAPAWNLADYGKKVNVDSIIKILDIQSPQKIDSLQKELKVQYAHWDSTFSSVHWKQDLAEMENRITSMRPEEIKTLEGLQSALATVQQVRGKVDSLEKFITKAGGDLKSDLQHSGSKIGLVDDWIKQDYQRALDKARLPELSKENMARFLFGGQVVNQATQALATVNTIRGYAEKFKSDKPKKEKPPRLKGQTIYFVAPTKYPNFWIKKLELSGHTTRGLVVEGTVKDITTQQSLIGRATTLQINAKRSDGAGAALFGELNYLGDSPHESFKLEMEKMPLQNVKISSSSLLPQRVESGIGRLTTSLELGGASVDGKFMFAADNLQFAFADQAPQKRLEQILQRLVQSATKLDLNVTLASSDERTDLRLNSNLDDLFASELKSMLSDEVANARAKIESYVGEKVAKYKEQFNALVSSKTASLQAEMASLENLLNTQKQAVEEKQKQFLARIDEEKQKGTKQVEDAVKKRLKGLGK